MPQSLPYLNLYSASISTLYQSVSCMPQSLSCTSLYPASISTLYLFITFLNLHTVPIYTRPQSLPCISIYPISISFLFQSLTCLNRYPLSVSIQHASISTLLYPVTISTLLKHTELWIDILHLFCTFYFSVMPPPLPHILELSFHLPRGPAGCCSILAVKICSAEFRPISAVPWGTYM